MRIHPASLVVLAGLVLGSGALGLLAASGGLAPEAAESSDETIAVAVRVDPVERGIIRDVRTLSGTLEAASRFLVSAEAAGLLDSLSVDISDTIEPGQIIATIDDRRFVQAIVQAEAELKVRESERLRAQSRLDVARAEFERERELLDDGVSSQSEYDSSLAGFEEAKADRSVADARVSQAQAALEIAQIRLDETRIRADFAPPGSTPSGSEDTDGSAERVAAVAVVSERYQEIGNSVGVGDAIIAGVIIDPIRAVVSITERDYTRLRPGQRVTLEADSVPGKIMEGEIDRISPVFRESSRQARVEIVAKNSDGMLKPGMFVRVRVVLEEREAHTIVPAQAIRTRNGREIVFAIDSGSGSGPVVREIPVTVGIRSNDRVEIIEPKIESPVVTLGHQLLDDGSPVKIADEGGRAIERPARKDGAP